MTERRLRLLLDEDVWPGLAAALRQAGYDAISVHEVGRTGFSDVEQMAFAVAEKRTLLSHNAVDFVPLAMRYFWAKQQHFGVVLVPHAEKGALVHAVLGFLQTTVPEELDETIRFVSLHLA